MEFSRETEPIGCICVGKREIYFKELAHVIVGSGKSEICEAGQINWRPKGRLMSSSWVWRQSESRIHPSSEELRLFCKGPQFCKGDGLLTLESAVGWMCLPQILLFKPVSQMVIFEMGAFGGWLGHEGVALMNGMSALMKRSQRDPSPLLLCEDTGKRQQNQEVGSHQTRTMPVCWSWTSQPLELWEINFCCF